MNDIPNSDIWTMNTDGTGKIKLTSGGRQNKSPQFSPDGSKIVYYSFSSNSNEDGIYIMNSDGKNNLQLTNTVGDDYWPKFSPIIYNN